jgi:hypothetical protein
MGIGASQTNIRIVSDAGRACSDAAAGNTKRQPCGGPWPGSSASAARLAMDPFEKKRLLPIEVMIALAINLVVAILGYYAIMMWGLFSG